MVNDTDSLTLQQRLDMAAELRRQGYNCAQAVIMVFPDKTGFSIGEAERISAAFGGGVAGTGEICGVVSAMAMVEGMATDAKPMDKKTIYGSARKCADCFRNKQGFLRCADLKGKENAAPCNDLIADGIRILHEKYNAK